MKALRCIILAIFVCAACGRSPNDRPLPTFPAWTATPTERAIVVTPAPRATLPPKPTPAAATPAFPTCAPDAAPQVQLGGEFGALTSAVLPDPNVPALRPLADEHRLYLGVSTAPNQLKIPEFAGLLKTHFNIIAAENAMKWEVLHPERERYDFTDGDALVAFAAANGLAVYGHALVWDLQQPAWLTGLESSAEGTVDRDEWIRILCRHVKTVASHYRGHIYAWDVVNEPFQNDGNLRDTLWLRTIGPEYIAMAFQWAREADPEARLILNEHFAEGLNRKSQAVFALVQGLLSQGIPIDGVGLQMHVWLYGPPSKAELEANMRRLAELGLLAQITEMDVRTQYLSDSPAQEAAAQAEQYRQAFDACLNAVNCDVFITWGLTDRYSWIPDYTGAPDAPLLFDRQSRPKPAFDAILELLQGE